MAQAISQINSSSVQEAEIFSIFNKYQLAAAGFRKAVNFLISKVIIDGEKDSLSLTYPIIFNSSNLIINQLKDIYVQQFQVQPCHHNILNLWHDVKEIVKKKNLLEANSLEEADKIINKFSEIDDITLNINDQLNIIQLNKEIGSLSSNLSKIEEKLGKPGEEKELLS